MKVFRRISMWLLTLIMLFSCVTPVSALESQHTRWPVFSELAEDRYIAGGGYVHFNGWSSGAYFGTVNNAYVQLTLPEGRPTSIYRLHILLTQQAHRIDGYRYSL